MDEKETDLWDGCCPKLITFVNGSFLIVNIKRFIYTTNGVPVVLIDDDDISFNWSNISSMKNIEGNVQLSNGRMVNG